MTTFDLAEVRAFTADLDARMKECESGEGMQCANLDDTLRHYAELCCRFSEGVRQWGLAIFYGRVAFDPEVETLLFGGADELYHRASQMWEYGQGLQGECFVLENGAALGSALWRLDRLLSAWVTPKPATAPLARNGFQLAPNAKDEVQRRVDTLPPLPVDWRPDDPGRRALLKKKRRQRLA